MGYDQWLRLPFTLGRNQQEKNILYNKWWWLKGLNYITACTSWWTCPQSDPVDNTPWQPARRTSTWPRFGFAADVHVNSHRDLGLDLQLPLSSRVLTVAQGTITQWLITNGPSSLPHAKAPGLQAPWRWLLPAIATACVRVPPLLPPAVPEKWRSAALLSTGSLVSAAPKGAGGCRGAQLPLGQPAPPNSAPEGSGSALCGRWKQQIPARVYFSFPERIVA